MRTKYDVLIIGGGLGGLLCANILSREGLSVCIVEQNNKAGGSIQSFVKNKTIFNTGLNYTESLGEGEVLNQYFKYFKIIDKLKIRQLDTDCFNKVSFGNETVEYPFAQGHDNFVEKLAEYFSDSKPQLKAYINTLKETCNLFPLYSFNTSSKLIADEKSLQISAFDYLKTVHPDKRLQNVLAGMNTLYGGVPEKTPLYMHALINYSFIKSSWRLVDGSSQLVSKLVQVITENGGEIKLLSKVSLIGGQNRKVTFVELANGERIWADKIISNVHPATTLQLVAPEVSKKALESRIMSLENTIGTFTLYMVMKNNSFPYLNYNHHHYSSNTAWTSNYKPENWPEHYFLYTPASSRSDQWASGVIAMTYMTSRERNNWENTFSENRGNEYFVFTRKKAEL
jgi:all-trans-retinol 13,14-reductase